MRLIDYNEIRKLFAEEYKRTAQLICDGETHLDSLAEGFTEADRVIYKLPDVDAVEVIRCACCIHYGVDREKGGFCKRTASPSMWRNDEAPLLPDDFCSYGERKELNNAE